MLSTFITKTSDERLSIFRGEKIYNSLTSFTNCFLDICCAEHGLMNVLNYSYVSSGEVSWYDAVNQSLPWINILSNYLAATFPRLPPEDLRCLVEQLHLQLQLQQLHETNENPHDISFLRQFQRYWQFKDKLYVCYEACLLSMILQSSKPQLLFSYSKI